MDVKVLLSSGDEDEWVDVADALPDEGSLIVLGLIDQEDDPTSVKTMEIRREIPTTTQQHMGGGFKVEVPGDPEIHIEVFQVLALYAPGMWMKAEFE